MELFDGQTVGMLVFFIGLFGLMTKKSIIKTIVSITVMESGVYLFFIGTNFTEGSVPPIGEQGSQVFADPVPSALMITSIVIGVAVTAIALTMFIHYKKKYGVTHWSIINREERSNQ